MKLLHSVNEFFLARVRNFSFSAPLSREKSRAKISRLSSCIAREAFVYAASRVM
jgi:hypothetical protein